MSKDSALDFEINVKGEEIRILQLTDFQPVDFSQQRYPDRLHGLPISPFTNEDRQRIVLQYVDELVQKTHPHLILITGDYVYGEFDDNGENLVEMSKHMDSFGIPWSVIFGNHDNESKKGVAWQCRTLESFSNCLFRRGNVTGNGNFTIGVRQNDELVKVIYMMDSNGCYNAFNYSYLTDYPPYNQGEKVEINAGVYDDQVAYIDASSKEIDREHGAVSKFICLHIPPSIISNVSFENGYQSDAEYMNTEYYTLGVDKEAKNGDFGTKGEKYCSFPSANLWPTLKANGFTHMFVGHDHNNDISVLCDGIRVTFGVKTGTGDYHKKIGGTLITLKGKDDVLIRHLYVEER